MPSKTEEYLALARCFWQHNFFKFVHFFRALFCNSPFAVKGLVQRFNRQAAYRK